MAKLAKQAQQASNVGEAVVRTADNAVETFANSADNFAVSAASQSPVKRFELPTIQSWCFAPDTLVDTPQGKRRIDEIRENDLVFAFDFTSGQWVERPVEVCHRNLYQGSLIEISTKHGTVVATAYHPFWVLEGHDLANRPRPRKLADTEDEGLALRGRWVNSHDLMAGDLIYSTEGRELRVLKIVQTYAEQFEVCNLTIAQNHSFAVGNAGVLVHNTGGCPKVDVGGLGYPGSMPGVLSKVTPSSLGARSIAEDARLHRMWEDSMRELYLGSGVRGKPLRDYLNIIEAGGTPSADQARYAYKSVRASFDRRVEAAIRAGEAFPGYSFERIHHWNWHMADHSFHALDPRQLFPVTQKLHELIHVRTTIGPVTRPLDIYFQPINPLHRIDLEFLYPLAPRRGVK